MHCIYMKIPKASSNFKQYWTNMKYAFLKYIYNFYNRIAARNRNIEMTEYLVEGKQECQVNFVDRQTGRL